MDVNSVISLADILDHVGDFTRPLKEGNQLANSNLFLHYGIIPSAADASLDLIQFFGVCLTSKISAKPHNIKIIRETLIDGSNKFQATCSCKAGSGKCKHVVALMFKLEKLTIDEVPVLSKTDITQEWGKVSKKHESANPSRLANLCHIKERKCSYNKVPDELPADVEQYVFENILQAFPRSISAVALNQLNADCDCDATVDDESHILEIIEKTFLKKHTSVTIDENNFFFILHANPQNVINFFHEHVLIGFERAVQIFRETKFQNNDLWRKQRQIRITGSNAYSLFTYAKNKKPNWDKKLRDIVYPTFKGNKFTAFGLNKEPVAKDIFAKTSPDIIRNCGLIVNPNYPWFGSSPDGFVLENNELILLEVKALNKGKTLDGAAFLQTLNFIHIDENNHAEMKQNHRYYAQIQLGLFLTNLRKAKLLLYVDVSKSVISIDVPFDEVFVNDLIRVLTNVYFNFYLPFLAYNG